MKKKIKKIPIYKNKLYKKKINNDNNTPTLNPGLCSKRSAVLPTEPQPIRSSVSSTICT